MSFISIEKIFEDEPQLLDKLFKFVNYPNEQVRWALVKSFFNHDQVLPHLKKNKLKPDYVYYIFKMMVEKD